MAYKFKVFHIIFVHVAVLFAINLRSRLFPISNDVKRSLGYPEDSLLNFTELSGRYGYDSEQHSVVTEDGYILTIFRINSRKCEGKLKKPPVILMHGLILSSDVWLGAGPESGLAYLISDACYDLWVGNQRGNYHSRQHVRWDPDSDAEFWQFSVDEIGLYDIPATIDYVLKQTEEEKLNYIGYSQGVSTFFVMCSERPVYCDKANILIGLAPASKLTHTKTKPFEILFDIIRRLQGVLSATGNYEMFGKGLFQELLAFLCKFGSMSEAVCGNFLTLIDSFHPGSIAEETLKKLPGHTPAGTSVRNIAWYSQALGSDRFKKYDHGKETNLAIYGEEEPPSHNLSAVSVPFVALYGNNDNLATVKDVMWLVKQLPNVLEAVEVANPLWNHFDVPFSQFTKELIFPKINEYLLKNSRG